MGMRWRGLEERRRGSAYVSAQGIGERQHEKTEWSAVPSDLLRFLGSKNLRPYWEQAYCKKGQQSLSSYCSMHQWAGVRQRSLGEKREALTSICPSLWYQYFHNEQFQATDTMSLNTGLGRDVLSRLFRASLSQLSTPVLTFILF